MERFAYKSLVEWKMSPQRKPLILRGARQVGKTWLLKEFGRRQTDSGIMPIEVKAAENLRSKSLRTFIAAHENLSGVRFSLSPYREQDWMRNIPLYAVGAFFGIRHPYTLA